MKLAFLLMLLLAGPLSSQSARKEAMAYGCYSNCANDAHVSFGMNIIVVLSNSGFWVLYQSCEGFTQDPVLIKATYDGSVFSFTVPDSKAKVGPGTFRGFAGPKELIGSFDRTPDEKLRIPKVGNYD